ncbi:MAG: ribosome recycling factor [Bacteroidales bacterium OttesenSCG-928-I14]|jgi:ribosome recycling factor|nr:ribosome recycling factor [Bacteroidales bacterium OttesenSCG-928-I14]
MKSIIDYSKKKMIHTLTYLEETFSHINAGRADVRMLDNIKIEYYGNFVSLQNISSISIPDTKTILISAWEKSMIKPIEKAILNSNLGITPENNGSTIKLNIPQLTEDRRKQLIKQTEKEAEKAKISIRNIRREANNIIKKRIKEGIPKDEGEKNEITVQKLHDEFLKKIDKILSIKEKMLMTI